MKPFNAEEVKSLIDVGALHAYDYIFSPKKKSWLRAVDCPEISNGIDIKFIAEEKFEVPPFSPPLIDIQVPSETSEDQVSEDLHEEIRKRNFEIRKLNAISKELSEEVDTFHSQNQLLHEQLSEKDNKLGELKTESIDKSEQIELLNSTNSELVLQVSEVSLKRDSYKERLSELKEEYKEVDVQKESLEKSQLVSKELESDFLEENKKFAEQLKKFSRKNKELRIEIQHYKDSYTKESKANRKLKNDVDLLNKNLIKLQKSYKKDKISIKNLEKYKATIELKEKEELNQLIGDSFELNNEPIWYIKLEGTTKGPFKYEDMKSFLKFKKIDNSTPVKKKGEKNWSDLRRTFEFTAQVVTKEFKVDGKKVKKFYMKRTEFRAPFYDVAVATIDGKEFRGYCTSLSIGGAFIEFPRLDLEAMAKSKEVSLRIVDGTLSQEIECRGVIRNVSERRPKGVGIQFVAMGHGDKTVISEFIDIYLKSIQKGPKDVKKAA